MRSIKKIFMLVLLAFITFTAAGCVQEKTKYTVEFETNGGTKIEQVYVFAGSKLTKPADPKKTNYVFDGWFIDASLEEAYDFEEPVKSNLKLYAAWEEVKAHEHEFVNGKCECGEIDADHEHTYTNGLCWCGEEQVVTEIVGITIPANIAEFNSTKLGSDNKRTEFSDLTKNYIVGDDNNWSIKPSTTFVAHNIVKNTYKPVTVNNWEYVIEMHLITEEGIKLIENEKYTDSIDYTKCLIDFGEEAIGLSFELVVYPSGLTEAQEKQNEETGKYQVKVEIEVVDGYNAYTALDLAYIENRTGDDEEGAAWIAFKNEKGIDVNKKVASVIMHNDITVTAADLPSYMFLDEKDVLDSHPDKELAMGSLRDYVDFYHRDLTAGDEFRFYGNYFTIDTSSTREVVRENDELNTGKAIFSHSQLMKFEGDGTSKVYIDSVNFIGNAPKVEDELKSGGLIMFKVENSSMHWYNVIATRCFITFMDEGGEGLQVIEKCKAYDAFNSFVYNWGGTMEIKDSEMIGAGGPVIIQDHVRPFEENEMISHTTIENCNLQSWVAGTEGWFNLTNATALVGGLLSMNELFKMYGRTFTKIENGTQYFNLVLVNKSGSAQAATAELVEGTAIIEGSTFDYGATSPYLGALIQQVFPLGAPIFQSSNSQLTTGFGFFNGQALLDVQQQPIVDPTNPLFSGDNLCIYLNGMMVILGYDAYTA